MVQGSFLWATVLIGFGFMASAKADSIKQMQWKSLDGKASLRFEADTDFVLHFEYSPGPANPSQIQAIPTSAMVLKNSLEKISLHQIDATNFSTAQIQVSVEPASLCFKVKSLIQDLVLADICPSHEVTGNSLKISAPQILNLYGLGEQFHNPGEINGDWMGQKRTPGNKFGNGLIHFSGGNTGNAQFPIVYALGSQTDNFALYVDSVYSWSWDFTGQPWKLDQQSNGADPDIRGYFIAGQNLPELRKSWMNLVGTPKVPPKKAFGLWVSEFGYRSWDEIDAHLRTLRSNHFPVDGFVLDLYWFGGFLQNSKSSPMGSLTWDQKNFPSPSAQIRKYKEQEGLELMTIEEPYVSENTPHYSKMSTLQGFVGKNSASNSQIFDSWWGLGSGIDWSFKPATDFWHDELRKKQLTDNGVTFHWTDLGEPEACADDDYYHNTNEIGHSESDVHNLYSFYWSQSIDEGYQRNHEKTRHFILSRSGAPGIQRFGTAMWSGDIGSNIDSLSAHLNAQMHMSMSGVDYFGSDIGGFIRKALVGNMDEVYTRWFAHSAFFDVPVRPHTDDGSKLNPTAPDRIGDLKSNLFNLRQRYELAPYYYSLAYSAHLFGEPIFPPLVYYFQTDISVRKLADEKMLGPWMLIATSAKLGEKERDIYLPKGTWTDFHTHNLIQSNGQTLTSVPLLTADGRFELPVFVKSGAILPLADVNDQTMNILGKNLDGSISSELKIQIYPSETATTFHVYEDDNWSEAYQSGEFRDSAVSQVLEKSNLKVQIDASRGNYSGAPTSRTIIFESIHPLACIDEVLLNSKSIPKIQIQIPFNNSPTGWQIVDKNTVRVILSKAMAAQSQNIEIHYCPTPIL